MSTSETWSRSRNSRLSQVKCRCSIKSWSRLSKTRTRLWSAPTSLTCWASSRKASKRQEWHASSTRETQASTLCTDSITLGARLCFCFILGSAGGRQSSHSSTLTWSRILWSWTRKRTQILTWSICLQSRMCPSTSSLKSSVWSQRRASNRRCSSGNKSWRSSRNSYSQVSRHNGPAWVRMSLASQAWVS